MSYRQVLDEAIGDSPISTVDVDRVIASQRRAGQLRRWGACGAVVVAVLAVAVTAARVLPDNTGLQMTNDRRITTVAGTQADMTRLDKAVFAAVKRVVPALKWQGPASPGAPVWSHVGGGESTLVSYFGQGDVSVGGVQAHFMVQVERYGALRVGGQRCVDGPSQTCRESAGPNGERIWTRALGRPDTSSSGRGDTIFVEILRPDDALVFVTLMMEGSADGATAMTTGQLTAIGLDPAIALAPVPPGVVVTPPAPAPPEPPASSTPKPAETGTSGPVDPAQQRRIDNAIFMSLRRQAPGVKGNGATDLAAGWTHDGGENTADRYWGQNTILVNGVTGLFSVQIERRDPGFSGDLTCGKPSTTYLCTAGKGPNGERYRTVSNATRQGLGHWVERDVVVLRKNGSWLSVDLTADPGGRLALTAAQQKAIAFDQAITLRGR